MPTEPSAAAFAEASLQTLMGSAMPVGLAVLDTELRFVQVNAMLAAANGLSIAKHLGRSVREVLPHAADALEPALRAVLETGKPSHHRQSSDDAHDAFQWQSSYLPIKCKAGHVIGVLVQVQNRARERRARQRLQHEGEQHLRRVLDSLFVFVGVLSPQGILLEANREPLQASGVTLDEVRGKALWETVWWAGDAVRQAWLRAAVARVAAGELVRSDVEIRMGVDQPSMMIDFMLAPLRDDKGQITHLIGSAIDVTERRAAQGEIERALREKTVLLNELHHRVKNNLQVISSLLNLQSNGAEPQVKAALRDSQSRVRSMALMHQLLYERTDFSALELGPYLHRLGSLLRDTYLGENAAVQLLIEAPETGLLIDLQRAIPCGLLVTELVTNAIKHAFPDGAEGRVGVSIAVGANGEEARVDVYDDGMGLAPGLLEQRAWKGKGIGFDGPERPPSRPRQLGLGFQLLPVLAEQCKARLEQLPVVKGSHFRLHLALTPSM